MLALLERLSGHEVPPEFATLLATETDGNPFFLRETLLHLVDEGRLREVDGVWVAAPGDLGIPAGVRDVVGRRLSRLSPDANKLLAAGALFEVAFPLAVVATVTKIDEDDALDAIDEALDARIVAASGTFDHYVFTHALFRHTLVEELNPSRQVRMHRAIAEAIEKDLRGAPDPATAATLARHFLHSAAIPGAERGVPYALAVADDAAARYARHEELARSGPRPSCSRRVTTVRWRSTAGSRRRPGTSRRDPDRVLAAAERAARGLASSVGDDAAADFVAELIAVPIEGAAVRWRLADLARQWLRADRRDRPWALIRECELDRRDHEAPEAPGIPVDDDAYRELRNVFARLPDEQRRSNYDTPATRAEAVAMLDTRAEIAFGWLWASGRWDLGVETVDDGIAEFRRAGPRRDGGVPRRRAVAPGDGAGPVR